MSCWALVPVKARSDGKQRLAPRLSDEGRAELIRTMLKDVLAALAQCAAVDETLVMSPARDHLPGTIELLADPEAGLNASLGAALQRLHQRGAQCVAIVAADLPFVAPAEIAALVTASRAAGIALAPDRSGSGTNAACLMLPSAFRFHFGPGSLERHLAEAARLGVTAATVRLAGLAFDIDEPADVAVLKARAAARYGFLS